MFGPASRYVDLEDAVLVLKDGREVAYKRRRFVPKPDDHESIGVVVVAPGDRLDLVAMRGLGDPEQFWLLCDANGALEPADLMQPGRRLTIPLPKP